VQIASRGPGIGPGDGPGPPIEVALVTTEITPLDEVSAAVVEEESEEAEAEPELEEKPERQLQEPTESADDIKEPAAPEPVTDKPPAQVDPFDAPDLLPTPAPIAPPAVAEPAVDPEASIAEEPPTDDRPAQLSDPPPIVTPAAPLPTPAAAVNSPKSKEPATPDTTLAEASERDATDKPTPASPASSAPTAPVPEAYADRFAANRAALVAGGGGNANTEQAVSLALAWLAAAQSESGRWDPRIHGAGEERNTLGQSRGGAGANADTGISSLALLAFLGAGHSHRQGPYSGEVARGLDFLRRSQHANGNLGGDAEVFAQMYCHSMASFAVGEAYALTQDKRLEPIVRAAVSYSLAVQHPTDGGWRYQPGQTGDTSQLGWQLMSLKSAELAGQEVSDVTWARASRFLKRVERGQFGGLAVYRPEEALPSRSMTAEALYCRQLITGRADGGLTTEALDEALDSLAKEPPSPRQVNLYYWYYATLALHRAAEVSPHADDVWRRWNEALTTTLLSSQNEDGSWPTTCMWGGYGGRVYTTSLAALSLEVYYRYAPSEHAGPTPANIAQRTDDAWK
jgi:hypothetical protein